jgi:hypothetical protein
LPCLFRSEYRESRPTVRRSPAPTGREGLTWNWVRLGWELRPELRCSENRESWKFVSGGMIVSRIMTVCSGWAEGAEIARFSNWVRFGQWPQPRIRSAGRQSGSTSFPGKPSRPDRRKWLIYKTLSQVSRGNQLSGEPSRPRRRVGSGRCLRPPVGGGRRG